LTIKAIRSLLNAFIVKINIKNHPKPGKLTGALQ
jgi:hypothetical protein